MRIRVKTFVSAERPIGLVAAKIKARVCLSGCQFCRGVIVEMPQRLCGGKTTADNCRVRIDCQLQRDPVRPPQGEITPEICPIKLRQKRTKVAKKQAA